MFHDFKLGVFALRHDILAVHFTVGHQLCNVLHDGVVGANWISSNYIDIGQLARDRNGFTASD